MNCLWEDLPSTTDARGWRRVRCTRRDCRWRSGINPTPHSFDKIFAECTGFPDDYELKEWVAFFSAAFDLKTPDAICMFIRWRADGADLSELDAFRGAPIPPTQPAPGFGPGTELNRLLAQLQIAPTSNCGCQAVADDMDRLGVKGVESERERFLTHLRTAYTELNPSWSDKAAIGTRALAMGLVISPLDPASSLLDESLRRVKFLARKHD